MPLSRRRFFSTATAGIAAGALAPVLAYPATRDDFDPHDWASVRRQFNLDSTYAHLGLFYLASHPRPVRAAVDANRTKLDANPLLTVEHRMFGAPEEHYPTKVCAAIASYGGVNAEDIALTQNTTMGLALLYHGLPLGPNDEILTTNHDHFVHHEAIRLSTERNGASWRRIPLFDSYDSISADGMVDRIKAAIKPNTRVVGVTWVHSASGLRLPIRRIADAIAEVNASRDEKHRVLLIVDGVHGIGVENEKIADLGADAFSAGLHKWIFAPRGTGFVWAKPSVWATMRPLIPSFTSFNLFESWGAGKLPEGPPRADWFSPGGFQAFEHYWAVPAAFEFHERIGRQRIADRIHALNQQMNEGLRKMAHVNVYTPRERALNAGMVCFDVKGVPQNAVVERLMNRNKVLGSTTPYAVSYARLSCGIMNTEQEVERALAGVRAMG